MPHDPIDQVEEHSCVLENQTSTNVDFSRLSDTLPSISIDDNNIDQDFYLKEHYDKIDKLRKENFDLKLKLYLLESTEKYSNGSELKFKVLEEFEKKDEEIRHLKENLKLKKKENEDLQKILIENGSDHKNKLLQTKLYEAIEVCANLIRNTEQLIRMNKKLSNNNNEESDILNTSLAYLEKASRFISDRSLVDLNKSKDKLLSDKYDNNRELISNDKFVQTVPINESTSRVPRTNLLLPGMISPHISNIGKYENTINDFMNQIKNLQELIENFRSNNLTYKLFSSKLDSIFEVLNEQHKRLIDLQLDKLEPNFRKKNSELMTKIKADLCKKMKKLDLIILKTQQSL